jgi:hypothetical protein
VVEQSLTLVQLARTIWAMQSPTTSELHLRTTQTDVQRPSGKVQLPQTYQFLQCFKCCFLCIEREKRKARTCSTCIPGVRICREQCKMRIVWGKHGANLASSKLELLDQLKSSLRLVKVSASASHGRESQSTGSRVDLARSTACFSFYFLTSSLSRLPKADQATSNGTLLLQSLF